MKPKLIYVSTLAVTMNITLRNQLRFMRNYFDVIGICAYDKKHTEDIIAREGVRIYSVNMSRRVSLFSDILALIKLVLLFKKEKPQIVCSLTSKAGILAMLASRISAVPVRIHIIVGLAYFGLSGLGRKILMHFEKLTLKLATAVYINSSELRKVVINSKLCDEGKIKVINNGSTNGIDINYFNPDYLKGTSQDRASLRSKIGLSTEDFVFCFIGRIAKDKGINELLDSHLRLVKELNNKQCIKLIFVGTIDKERGDLNNDVVNSIKSGGNILYLGRYDDIRPYLIVSDVLVLPSYREGFPKVLMEAGAMGLPCIVTDINGCNEIIINNENGLIIPLKDASALKAAMQKLVLNRDLKDRLASNSRELVVRRYRQEDHWEVLLKEFLGQLKSITKNDS